MKFNVTNLRTIDAEFSIGMRKDQSSPLVLVRGNGEVSYARNRGDKDCMLDNFNEETDVLMYMWKGRYYSDVFLVTKADLKKHYN